MKKKNDMPVGKLKRAEDFLPLPGELVVSKETIKNKNSNVNKRKDA